MNARRGVIAAVALGVGSWATTSLSQPLLPPRTYASGGVGSDERRDLQSIGSLFNLHVAFALAGSGAYVANVALSVRRAGDTRVEPVCVDCGPWVFVALRPGTYTLFATWEGSTRTQMVQVGKSPTRTVIYWPGSEVEGRTPPAQAM